MLRPTSGTPEPTAVLVVGTPTLMAINGVLVRDPAAIGKIVRDLNTLHPYPYSGIAVQSCPNYVGQKYVLRFTYSNGDRWS